MPERTEPLDPWLAGIAQDLTRRATEGDFGDIALRSGLAATTQATISSRVASAKKLRRLAARAQELNLNRKAPPEVIERLDPNGYNVIDPIMEHHYIDGRETDLKHHRTVVYAKLIGSDKPSQFMLDIEDRELRKLREVDPRRKLERDPDWQMTLQLLVELRETCERNPAMMSWSTETGLETEVPLHPSLLEGLDPWHASAEMLDLVEHAAEQMPSYSLNLSDVFTATGFCVLERPFFVDHPSWGEIPIRAFIWRPAPGGIFILAMLDLAHDSSPTDIVSEDPYRSRLWPAMHWQWKEGDRADKVLSWVNAQEQERTTLLELSKFIAALWLLSNQRVALVTGQKPVRALRRQAERLALPSTVLVVTLRRALVRETEGGEPHDVNWSHRWVVSGHWRRIWSKREDREVLIWVTPYIKGPEGKPLIVKDRFYKFRR